jgi:hypothetical protein
VRKRHPTLLTVTRHPPMEDLMGLIKIDFKGSTTSTWMNKQMVKIDQKLEEMNKDVKLMWPRELKNCREKN